VRCLHVANRGVVRPRNTLRIFETPTIGELETLSIRSFESPEVSSWNGPAEGGVRGRRCVTLALRQSVLYIRSMIELVRNITTGTNERMVTSMMTTITGIIISRPAVPGVSS